MRSHQEKGLQRIIVPVNGSPADEAALRMGMALAKQNKGKVMVLNVVEVARDLPLDAAPEPDVVRGETLLERMEGLCKEDRCPFEAEIVQAREAGPAIVEEALQLGADLIIMGMAVKRHRGEYTLGTTVPYVLLRAPCRVWVAREQLGVGAQAAGLAAAGAPSSVTKAM